MLEGMGRFHTQLRRTADARQCGLAPTAAVQLLAARSVRAEWRLPRLDARVPLELTPRRLASANAAVARFLLEAKAVCERDIPAAWNDELLVCQGALDAWVKREIGALSRSAVRVAAGVGLGARSARLTNAEGRVQPNPDCLVPAGRTAVGCRGRARAAGAGDADAWRHGLASAG